MKHALELFHRVREFELVEFQVAIGNLCVAIELALKTLIAREAFHLLFKDLPKELELALCYPASVKGSFTKSPHVVDLAHAAHATIGLDEAISLAYVIVPKLRDELRGHLKTVREVRNASIHYLVPKALHYQLDRVGYVALRICELARRPGTPPLDSVYQPNQKDLEFIKSCDQARIESVAKKIEQAKTNAKKTDKRSLVDVDADWTLFEVKCPVCGSDGVMQGNTDEVYTDDPEDGPSLWFTADSFWCDVCGLKLEDPLEMKLAGLSTDHERHRDLRRWMGEKYGHDDDY